MNNIFLLDKLISNNIHNLYNPILNKIFILITNLANTNSVIIISILILFFLYYKKDKFNFIFYLSSIFIGLIFVELLKNLIKRIRPQDKLVEINSYAFPSGHTTFSSIIALSVYLIYKDIYKNKNSKKYLYLIFLYPIIIGFSRIYLNVHWFSDVIGGIILGFLIVISSLQFNLTETFSKYEVE